MPGFWFWLTHYKHLHRLHEQLFDAIFQDDIQAVQRAIDAGVDLRGLFRSNEPDPPLLYPAYSGNGKMFRILMDGGADINQTGMGDFTPLMAAASSGHAHIVEMLVDRGARKDLRDDSGRTASDYAASCKDDLKRQMVLHALNTNDN